MIITLITGEKVKVKETWAQHSNILVMTDFPPVIKLTVLETKIVKGEYKACETSIYYRVEHIVSYEEND